MAAGNTDGIVRLWDVTTGMERAALTGHKAPVRTVAYRPDGKVLATGCDDGTTKLWDLSTRKEQTAFAGHKAAIRSIAFSPDGKLLATGCEDGTVKLWDLAEGSERVPLANASESVQFLTFSWDNETLAMRGERLLVMWTVATGQQRASVSPASGYVFGYMPSMFAADGKTLVTTEGHPFIPLHPGYVKVREAATGKELATWTVPRGAWGAAFAPDNRTLAVGSGSGVVRLWNLATKQVRATFRGHFSRVSSVAFSPDGRMLASSGSWDQTAKLWDVTVGPEPRILPTGPSLLAPDGKTLAQLCGPTVKLWDLDTAQAQASLAGHSEDVNDVAFAPGGKIVATASNDKTVRLWERATGEQLAVLRGHTDRVTAVAFAPDAKTLASSSWDHTVRLWDMATRQEHRLLKGHTHQVWHVAFAPDGQTLASGSQDTTIKLWDVATAQPRFTLEGHVSGCGRVAFAPDGKTLASAGDYYVRLWDLATGKERAPLKGHAAAATTVAFAPDGDVLASGGYDCTVKLWDLTTGLERFTLTGHTGIIQTVAFAPNGRLLVTSAFEMPAGNSSVRLWHAAGYDEKAMPAITPAPSLEDLFAWHRREADASEREQQWFGVVFHLNHLIDAQPADPQWYSRRGLAHAKLGHYERALKDFGRAFRTCKAK